MNTARRSFASTSAGTQTATLAAGGEAPNTAATELWNGSSWTEVADLNAARHHVEGAGTTTSGLAFSGNLDPGQSDETESWNGSSWTELSDMNQGRNHLAGCGASNTSALAFGGEFSPLYPSQGYLGLTESWNGSAWTEVADLNTDRAYVAGLGTQTAALCISGTEPPLSTKTEDWNGSAWTEVADVSTARMGLAAAGNSTNGLAFGGGTPGATAATEEWTVPTNTTVTFTVS